MSDWRHARGALETARPLVMGILNLTPDSFSDGGALPDLPAALEHARRLVAEGADLLDVGGESTRPGADPVSGSEELDRVLPFIEAATASFDVPVSIDTRRGTVARTALEAGASIVNDVTGLRSDPAMAGVCAGAGAGVILMHMRGTPRTMSALTDYEDVVEDVVDELSDSVELALAAGVSGDRIVVDPGIGFAKTAGQSFEMLRRLDRLTALGYPVLVGPSRKSFLGAALGLPTGERLEGTLAACVAAYLGGARIFRVHDVGPVRRALTVARAVAEGLEPASPDGVDSGTGGTRSGRGARDGATASAAAGEGT